MRPVPFSQVTLFLRNRNSTPFTLADDHLGLARLHARKVELHAVHQHAVVLQCVGGVVEFLG